MGTLRKEHRVSSRLRGEPSRSRKIDTLSFPSLLSTRRLRNVLEAIAVDREQRWQQMRDYRAKQWRRARRPLRDLRQGPRSAIKRYWQICGFPGEPDYLLSITSTKPERSVTGTSWPSSVAFEYLSPGTRGESKHTICHVGVVLRMSAAAGETVPTKDGRL
jgi:hypothetical protein